MTSTGTTGRIAALALCKAHRSWWLTITNVNFLRVIWRIVFRHHSSVPPWPAQTVRIARAASYLITLSVGQALAACGGEPPEPPKAQGVVGPGRRQCPHARG